MLRTKMTGCRRKCFYCLAFALTALAFFLYLLTRMRTSSLPSWANHFEPRCNITISYNPPDSYGELSPVWNSRPEFVWRSDKCSSNLHLSQKQADYNSSFLIPRIIHQVWDSNNVPELYINWTRSWLKVNPGWQHWFWTFSDVRELIARHYPANLKTWDSYPKPIFRADATRYFVVHRYGGVYVDLDSEALRPLDLWAQQYRCFFSEEPYEHAYIPARRTSSFLSSAFIACSQGHPALMALIDRMIGAFEQHKNDVMRATGPFMMDPLLKNYSKLLQNRQSQTTKLSCVDASVAIFPPYYFQPVYSPKLVANFRTICSNSLKLSTSKQLSIICAELRQTNFSNQLNPIAYAVHWWYGAWYQFAWKKIRLVNVFESVPGIRAPASSDETDMKSLNWCK